MINLPYIFYVTFRVLSLRGLASLFSEFHTHTHKHRLDGINLQGVFFFFHLTLTDKNSHSFCQGISSPTSFTKHVARFHQKKGNTQFWFFGNYMVDSGREKEKYTKTLFLWWSQGWFRSFIQNSCFIFLFCLYYAMQNVINFVCVAVWQII